MNKYKKDDTVLIIAGKDKGKKGKVLSVDPLKQQVIVDKVNVIKKHLKPTQDAEGSIKEYPAPIHWSNCKVICPSSKKPSRVGFTTENGKKERIAKVSQKVLK